ncbi:hypothetical protein [Clostridium sp.]|uniref:hypothetical protein n=1 Tax=Clostridium sp. TaxID=1506 RepID=UPI002FC95AD8
MADTSYGHLRGNKFDDTDERLIQQAYGSDLYHFKRTNNKLHLYTDFSPEFRPFLAALEMDEVEKIENPIEDKLKE